MKKQKGVIYQYIPSDVLKLVLIIPLLILKGIGDGVILIFKILFWIFIKSILLIFSILRKVKSTVFSFVSNLHNKLKSSFKKIKPKKTKQPKKKVRSVKIKLPKINLPKLKISSKVKLSFIKIKYFTLGIFTTLLIVSLFYSYTLLQTLPNPKNLSIGSVPITTKIYDRNGHLLYEIYTDENRTPIKLKDVPDIVKNATIAIEDKEFYLHQGLSIKGIIRALVHNLSSEDLEGGSTITQQLVRSTFLTPEKTYARKIKEIFLSVWTEQIYTKDQILEMYLNQVPYGGTAWGIQAAAQTYFGKNVTELTLAEASLLAGLPASPSRFSPFGSHPELAKQRQQEVLERMAKDRYITKTQKQEALEEKLDYVEPKIAIEAPHFVMYIKEILEKYYGAKMVEKGGLRVTTSLDLSIQNEIQEIVTKEIEKLGNLNVSNGATLVTKPNTGEVLAMIGSIDYFDEEKEGNVNIALSLRQPGSSIKVVTYAAALSKGYTPASIINDSPISYKAPGQPPYSPINYDRKFHGPVPLRTALASSYNIPAVKLLARVGIDEMIKQAKQMGITTWKNTDRFGLSLTLGGGEVTMLDMAKVYGTLANKGVKKELKPILSIVDYKGEKLPLPPNNNSRQAVSEEVAFLISSILSDNRARTPAFGSNSSLVIPGKTVAVKTGTSDNKRDNWTIGYTPEYVVTTWVGNNNNSPMHPTLSSGVTGASPIWNKAMMYLLKNKQDQPFIQPENVVAMPCYGRTEYFISGTRPKGGCRSYTNQTKKPTPTKNP